MSIALWIVNATLAFLFLCAGGAKLLTRKQDLLARDGMGWAVDYSPAAIKSIAGLELLGALGLMLPLATGLAPVLTPAAAAGLLVTMLLAIAAHRRRGEHVLLPSAFALLSAGSLVLGGLVVAGAS